MRKQEHSRTRTKYFLTVNSSHDTDDVADKAGKFIPG